MTCGCSGVEHAPGGDTEDDQRMGRLLTGSPCSHLTTKVKGGGGLRVYKRNRMIVTNPVVSRKDPTFNTTTYDWAPAGLNQTLVRVSSGGWAPELAQTDPGPPLRQRSSCLQLLLIPLFRSPNICA